MDPKSQAVIDESDRMWELDDEELDRGRNKTQCVVSVIGVSTISREAR